MGTARGITEEIVIPIVERLCDNAFDIWWKNHGFQETLSPTLSLGALDGRGDNEAGQKLDIGFNDKNTPNKINSIDRSDNVLKQFSLKDFFPYVGFCDEENNKDRFSRWPHVIPFPNEEYELFEKVDRDTYSPAYLAERKKRLEWLADQPEQIISIINLERNSSLEDGCPSPKVLDDINPCSDDEFTETRRRVYWSGPGLLQERHVPTLFEAQEIPEGVRPTLAYVSSDEMVQVKHPDSRSVPLTPCKSLKRLPYRTARKQPGQKMRKPLAKRVFSSLLKAVGIKQES